MRLLLITFLLQLTISTPGLAEVRYPVEQLNQHITTSHKLKNKARQPFKPRALQDPGVMVALLVGLFFTLLFGTFIFAWLSSLMPVGWALLLSYGGFILLLAMFILMFEIADAIKRHKRKKQKRKEGRKSYSF